MDTELPVRDGIAEAVRQWLAQNAEQGVLVTDTDLVIVSWNNWLIGTTGLAAEDVVGRHLFDAVPSLRERGLDQYYADALAGQVVVLSHSFHRFIVPTPGMPNRAEQQMLQSGRIAPLTGPSGIIGTITVIDDVSDRVASEQHLRARIAAAEAASRVKDEFLATLSHEIRTPLNAVLGWTRILRSRAVVDEATLRRAIEVIDRNASAQLTLVSDMLDMARISSGKVRLDMAEIDLGSVAEAAVDAARPAAEIKGVRLITELGGSIPSVTGDADRLLQVVWNLISNAVKFTDSGGAVTIRLAIQSRMVILSVEDTGQGIDPAFLPHVFERFKQADPSSSRRHGGLGLGLALVKDLVQLHGGTVTVASAGQGSGTTFRVRLPARGVSARTSATPNVAAPTLPAPLHGLRVLVVEDDVDSAEIVMKTLHDAGARAAHAATAEKALALVREGGDTCPQVIVTDIGMPDYDGYSLLEGVRALPHQLGGAVPVIALTAYATPEDRTRALSAGFLAHLGKPFNPEELIAAVARAGKL